MDIREATTADARALAAIYNHYVATSVITFDETPLSPEDLAARIKAVHSSRLPWFVAVERGILHGYAYATPWKSRSAYRFAAEVTVYLAPEQAGRGTGTTLYRRLLPELEARGLHTLLAGIALPNPASIALHERFGFRKVAHLAEVDFKQGRWVDVGYWQLVLNERKNAI